MIRKYWLFILGVLVISSYFVSLNFVDLNTASTVFVTITTIIGGLAIWVQLKRERDLKEAEFLMTYNNFFIQDTRIANIQKALEDYSKGQFSNKINIKEEYHVYK